MTRIPILAPRLLLVFLLFSCATPTQIVRETSAPTRPGWIVQPPQAPDALYFTGMSSASESLEQGQEAAIKNAMAKIANFLGTRIYASFEEYTTEIEQHLKQQIKAKSTASVWGARVVDSYYEKLVRVEKEFRLENYDVYVLISFPKSEIEKEVSRQQQEKTEKVKTAHELYVKGKHRAQQQAYGEAKAWYKQALEILGQVEDILVLDQGGITNSVELHSLLEAGLQEVTSRMRRLMISVKVNGSERAYETFRSHLTSSVGAYGFTVTQEGPMFEIKGDILVSESSYVMNNFVYYAQGGLSAVRLPDQQIVATVPLKTKGFHRDRDQAALNALAEAGNEAGVRLAKIILERE